MDLKNWIEKRGLTQTEAAKLLGESQSTVSRWTSGKRKILPEKVLRVAKVTGIPPHDLRPDIYPETRP